MSDYDQNLQRVHDWMSQTMICWRKSLDGRVTVSSADSAKEIKLLGESEKVVAQAIYRFKNENRKATNEIFSRLVHVVELATTGQFRDAVQEYMRASIGSNAWVTGVGNCFIQERSGNDKIREVSHPMNDMNVRDFMQTFKRLLTKAEQFNKSAES